MTKLNASPKEYLAIIPARGGSKGVPRKNVLPLAGKPLIAHSIEQAQQSKFITRIVVSTDDAEIAATANTAGAEVVWRPAEISGDNASSESALIHTLQYLDESEGYRPEILVFLQCTSPLTRTADIDGTIESLLNEGADTALAVTPFHYFLWKYNPDQDAIGINHDKQARKLRQEQDAQYLEAGAVYVMRVAGFLEAKHRFFGGSALYVMPTERRLEIDEPVDLKIAEVLLGEHHRKNRLDQLPEKIEALVMDFDGVFTDNKVLVFENGQEAVLCDRGDGWGLRKLREAGMPMLILSTETNTVVKARADKLNIPCLHGIAQKGAALQEWITANGFDTTRVIYIGNGLNDLGCMEIAGCAVAVADAHPQVKARADIVLDHAGGSGALSELCELILEHNGLLQ